MSFLSKVGHTLKTAVNPAKTAKRVAHYAGAAAKTAEKQTVRVGAFGLSTVKASLTDLRRRPVTGLARLAVSSTPIGAVGLLAYDAKRLRDKTARAKRMYRTIKKQAFIDAGEVAGRIEILKGHSMPTPIHEYLSPLPAIPAAIPTQNVAQPGPDLPSQVAPGPGPITLAAPTPDQRGAGGDNAEGVRTVNAGAGQGIGLIVVVGVALAVLASRGRAKNE